MSNGGKLLDPDDVEITDARPLSGSRQLAMGPPWIPLAAADAPASGGITRGGSGSPGKADPHAVVEGELGRGRALILEVFCGLGVPKKQGAGPRPESTQTLFTQNG